MDKGEEGDRVKFFSLWAATLCISKLKFLLMEVVWKENIWYS